MVGVGLQRSEIGRDPLGQRQGLGAAPLFGKQHHLTEPGSLHARMDRDVLGKEALAAFARSSACVAAV